jgi:serine/threonine protein phosphatase 1
MLKHFGRNEAGRDLIVGDIHGCFGRLQVALDELSFDPERDRLFSVGDLVDRGPESDAATEWLKKPWFHAVRGNHEQMAIDFADGGLQGGASMYVMNGGGWNLSQPPARSLEIADAFRAMPVAIELETAGGLIGIVHADCPDRSWEAFKARLLAVTDPDRSPLVQTCLWDRSRAQGAEKPSVDGVQAVIVGHTPMQQITWIGNVVYIDTGAVFGRALTILDAESIAPAAAVVADAT